MFYVYQDESKDVNLDDLDDELENLHGPDADLVEPKDLQGPGADLLEPKDLQGPGADLKDLQPVELDSRNRIQSSIE